MKKGLKYMIKTLGRFCNCLVVNFNISKLNNLLNISSYNSLDINFWDFCKSKLNNSANKSFFKDQILLFILK